MSSWGIPGYLKIPRENTIGNMYRGNLFRRASTYYGVQLLDDLHAYFPDILYNPGRFQSTADLINYIRSVARRMERPYDRGMRDYLHPNNLDFVRDSILHRSAFIDSFLENELRRLRRSSIVAPSAEEIESSTSLVTIEMDDATNMCSICHENFVSEQRVRKINHCGHFFHESCINSWLNEHPTCPNCRHDIRPARVESEEESESESEEESRLLFSRSQQASP